MTAFAIPSDSGFRLKANERLRVEVRSSAGDVEDLSLSARICSGAMDCSAVSVTMVTGQDAHSLIPVVFGIPGRFWSISVSGRFGGVRLFDPRTTDRAIDLIRRQPGVSSADRTGIGFSPEGPGINYAMLVAAVPIAFASAKPHNGILETGSGQTITLSYQQPSAQILSSSFSLP